MENIIAVNYSQPQAVESLGIVTDHAARGIVQFSLEKVMLLRLDKNPKQPPYFNFSDTNTVWKFAGSRSSDLFLDLWMAIAISQFAPKGLWQDYDLIYCPGSIFTHENGCIIPILKREKEQDRWMVDFVTNGIAIRDKSKEAIGFLPDTGLFDVLPPKRVV